MKKFTLDYKLGNTINVIQAKESRNSKIGDGYIVQTYHFSLEQVKNVSLTNDSHNCMDCPLSFNQNNGKSGGCYTHKGMQYMGLMSMLKRLNRNLDSIKDFDIMDIVNFVYNVSKYRKVELVRFGAYGEPILLPLNVVKSLSTLSRKTTGYTHQWQKPTSNGYNQYFMASTHTESERIEATKLGYRSFYVAESEIKGFKPLNAVNCPASKESDKNLTCIACGLCNGAIRGNKKDIYINKH